MKDATTKTKKKLPVWAAAAISSAATAAVLLVFLAVLLGRDGLAVVEGWLLARYAFVEADADLGQAADSALYGLVAGLGDRWSYYITPESYESMMDRRANRYLGIGVTVSYEDERGLLVQAVTADGPADRAGMEAGDVITAVDGYDLSGEARYGGVDPISGAEGERRVLTVLRRTGEREELTLTLEYIAQEVVTGRLLEGAVGLVTIRNFNTNAASELEEEVNALVEQGAVSLIFDVRNNGGGYIRELTKILDFLLPEGQVFQSEPRWGLSSVSRSDEACVDLPFGVLVNGGTYSAAELFAAQLRESVGAAIVGEVTSGKGYSQNTFHLANGGALGLSTAQYGTGGGISLIGTGITPDIVLSLDEERTALYAAARLEPEDDPQLQELIGLMEAALPS